MVSTWKQFQSAQDIEFHKMKSKYICRIASTSLRGEWVNIDNVDVYVVIVQSFLPTYSHWSCPAYSVVYNYLITVSAIPIFKENLFIDQNENWVIFFTMIT